MRTILTGGTPSSANTIKRLNDDRWKTLVECNDHKAIWGAADWSRSVTDGLDRDKASDEDFKDHFEKLTLVEDCVEDCVVWQTVEDCVSLRLA